MFLVYERSKFTLEIGLTPIPKEIMVDSELFITVGKNKFLLTNITKDYFRREIESVPDSDSNLYITYSDECSEEIKNINGIQIDSLENGWAIFRADTGKKIPCGGQVYDNQGYYLMAKNLKIIPLQLKVSSIGFYKDPDYQIFFVDFSKIHITVEIEKFLSTINVHIKQYSERPIVLWPPCINNNGITCPVRADSKILIWADNPEGSRTFSAHFSSEPEQKSGKLLSFESISEHTLIDLQFKDSRDSIEFDQLGKQIVAPIIPMVVEFVDKNDTPLDKFGKNVKEIKFNFIAKLDAVRENGICDHRDVKYGTLDNDIHYIRAEVYSKYRYITSLISFKDKTEKKFSRYDLMSYPRVKVPSGFDKVLLNCFASKPDVARLVWQSCSDGTISKSVLEKLMLRG